ncbi:MAG: hypothetical protein Q4G59_11055, partial [Planctomycetia bacterium]|nr:hypothetical protein [Planctomycetia bacterium]
MEKRILSCNSGKYCARSSGWDITLIRLLAFGVIASLSCFTLFTSELKGNQTSSALSPRVEQKPLSENHSVTMESVSADGSTKRSVHSDEERGAGPQLYGVSSRYVAWTMPGGGLVSTKIYFPTGVRTPCPIVIFSHGLGGSAETCAYLGKMWASRGIISFHLEHPGSNEQIWRGKVRAKDVLRSAYQSHWSGRDRALAIRFVLDQLEAIAAGKTTDQAQLAPILDMKRIGIAGNDLGALGAMLVAGQLPPDNGESLKDDRISAVLALSPPVFCNVANAPLVYGDVQVPFMSFGGTLDNGVIGSTKAWQRRIPFDSLSNIDRYHITLQGADHLVYSGVRPRGRQSQGTKDPVFQKTIMEVSTAFWALYL